MEVDRSTKVKDNKKSSKPRCRMKKLLNSVQELLDFYFGDTNLNHDRFLRKEIENNADGYVELSTMLKFNKLKRLTSDTTLLAKAVGNSSTLELSGDGLKVRRKEKLQELQNTDLRTVYVEEFPLHIDHDWLKSVFSTCGKVEYVSLPKFKHNNQLKGFAFIEFSTPEEAQKACQELNTIRCRNRKRLSTECREDESAKKKNNRKRRSTSECDSNSATNHPNARRRRSISESSDGSPVKLTKRRRRSSLSSTEELDEGKRNIEQTSNSTKSDVFITSKKQRHKENSISSDSENPSVSGKNDPKTVFQKPDCVNLDPGRPPIITKATTPNRKKRKSSAEVKEIEINKATSKELLSDQDIKSTTSSTGVILKSQMKDNDPNKKVTTFVDVKAELGDLDNKVVSISSNPVVSPKAEVLDSICDDKQFQVHKRKSSSSSELQEIKSPLKKAKVDETCQGVQMTKTGVETYADKNDKCDTIKDDEMCKKKKNRQHKKKDKKGEKVTDAISLTPLHVISKGEWLTLKKEYKRLQRIKMSELKRNLKVLKSEKVRRIELKERINETMSVKNEQDTVEHDMCDQKKYSIDEEKENHLDSELVSKESEESKLKIVDSKPNGLNILPGTVVGLKTSSETLTRKDVKNALLPFGNVVYVDYVDGVYQGFIRFAKLEDVENVMSANPTDKLSWPFQLRKLSNEEEKEYFRKAEEDRLKKYNKDKRKKRKERGVEKITRDVETVSSHIHFT